MKNTLFAIMLSTALFSLSSFNKSYADAVTVSGVVVSENGKPVAGVLTYITSGEEEALTNSKGEFSIRTMRSTPFVLTAEHWEYKKEAVTVSDAGKRITVRLIKKK